MVEIKDIKFDVIIERKKIKNIYMRLDNNNLSISAPLVLPEYKIYQFIESKRDWIYKAYLYQQSKKVNSLIYRGGSFFYIFNERYELIRSIGKSDVRIENNRIYLTYKNDSEDGIKYLYKYLDKYLLKKADELFEKHRNFLIDYGYELLPMINARCMTSKWGVCYPTKNKITVSSYLIHYPLVCLEYIMVHEMTHFIMPNHSNRFYKIVENNMPDYKKANEILRQM